MAYLLQVEQLERRVATAQQVTAVFLAAGAKDMTMPDPEQVRAEFDAALEAPPKMVDRDELELRRRLRVA